MALEKLPMQGGKRNVHPPRRGLPARTPGLGAGFEADTWGLSVATEASRFCTELEREFRGVKSCAMAWVCCTSSKGFRELVQHDLYFG